MAGHRVSSESVQLGLRDWNKTITTTLSLIPLGDLGGPSRTMVDGSSEYCG